jgi:hypothetical protein
MRLRLTGHRKVSCAVHAAFAEIIRNCLEESTLHVHLIERGFMNNYTLWTKHGEPGVLMEDDEDADDDNNIPDLAHLYEAGAFDDEPMDEAEENIVEQQPHDELGQVLLDAHKGSDTVKEPKKFEKMGITLELLHWKAANGITEKGFEELSGIVKNMLPEGNNCPQQCTKQKRLFALLDWMYRRFTLVLMTVCSIAATNMRN